MTSTKIVIVGAGAADQRSILAQPIDDRIFFAGEATSSNAYASVHGACISGRDAARATVAQVGKTVNYGVTLTPIITVLPRLSRFRKYFLTV